MTSQEEIVRLRDRMLHHLHRMESLSAQVDEIEAAAVRAHGNVQLA